MGILDRASSLIVDAILGVPKTATKSAQHKYSPNLFPLISQRFLSGGAIFPEKSLEDLAEMYGAEVWAYSAIYAKAVNISRLPFKIYMKNADGEREYKQAGPAFDLYGNLNDDDTMSSLLEKTVIYLETVGWAHWELGRGGNNPRGKIQKIWPIESWRMYPEINDQGIASWDYYVSGNYKKIDPAFIFHVKYFNPTNELFGLSPLHVVFNPVLRSLYQEKWALNYFKNGAIPPVFVTYPEDEEVKEEVVEELRARWKKRYAGPDKAQELGVLTGGAKIEVINQNLRSMDLSGNEQSVREKILAATNVPPIYLGIVDTTKYQTGPEQKKIFWENSLIPIIHMLEERQNRLLLPQIEPGAFIEYDLSGVEALKENLDAKIERYVKGVNNAGITPNEFRQDCFGKERDDDPAMDRFYFGIGVAAIGIAGQAEEPKSGEMAPELKAITGDNGHGNGKSKLLCIDGRSLIALPGKSADAQKVEQSLDSLLTQISKLTEYSTEDVWAYGGELHRKAMAQFEQRVASVEEKLKKYWVKETRTIVNSLIDVINQGSVTESTLIIEPELAGRIKQRAAKQYRQIMTDVFNSAGQVIEEDIRQLVDSEKKAAGTGRGEQSVELNFEDYFSTLSEEALAEDLVYSNLMKNADKLSGIYTDRLREGVEAKLRSELMAGIKEGDSLREIAQRFKQSIPELTDVQVTRTARTSSTEIWNASTHARYESINRDYGLEIVEGEQWLAALDDRTRDTHRAAHLQLKKLGEKFEVGNDRLDYPGDGSGSAEETFNCRCATRSIINYERAREAAEQANRERSA